MEEVELNINPKEDLGVYLKIIYFKTFLEHLLTEEDIEKGLKEMPEAKEYIKGAAFIKKAILDEFNSLFVDYDEESQEKEE